MGFWNGAVPKHSPLVKTTRAISLRKIPVYKQQKTILCIVSPCIQSYLYQLFLRRQAKMRPNHVFEWGWWSSGINAANGARGPWFASRILPTVRIIPFSTRLQTHELYS